MKQLLYILFATILFTSCSSDDPKFEGQDYTSFTVVHNENITLWNTVAAYKKDGKYYKIATLGDLKQGIPSEEVKITDTSVSEIYLFTDYSGTGRFDATYKLKNYIKNSIVIDRNTGGVKVTDTSDPAQYPQ